MPDSRLKVLRAMHTLLCTNYLSDSLQTRACIQNKVSAQQSCSLFDFFPAKSQASVLQMTLRYARYFIAVSLTCLCESLDPSEPCIVRQDRKAFGGHQTFRGDEVVVAALVEGLGKHCLSNHA